MRFCSREEISKVVKVWLIIGLVMVFFQVVLGGITRLTGSGLSITKWEIIMGTIPPLNSGDWKAAFDLYKATPQYEKINEGMSLSHFKFIYFWEFFHRLWAKTMGFVFLFPFLFFLFKGMLSKTLLKDLGIVILLAVIVASMGWIMVASGLINRPWVNAYKLTFHLSLAFILFGYLLWTTFKAYSGRPKVINNLGIRKWIIGFVWLLGIQIFLGGIMSGMKAGLFYPTWPDMNGELIPSQLLSGSNWIVDNFVNYDKNSFMPGFIQFFHRSIAYLLIINGLWIFKNGFKQSKRVNLDKALLMLITMLVIQIILGILTVINCKSSIPLNLGVLHQAGALLLFSASLYLLYLNPKLKN